MKSLLKNLFIAFIAPLLCIAPMVNGIANGTGLPPWLALVAVLLVACALYLVPVKHTRRDVHVASVDVEIWANYIIDRLWKDNKFLKYAWNDDCLLYTSRCV